MHYGRGRVSRREARPEEAMEARYRTDRHFRAAFISAYGGELPPEEAVRLFARPHTRAPDGSSSPTDHLDELRKSIYSGRATPEDRATYLEVAVRVSQDEASAARALAFAAETLAAARPSASLSNALKIGAGALVGGFVVLGIAVSAWPVQPQAQPARASATSSTTSRSIAVPTVPNPHAGGRTLARLSNLSAPVGGQLQASGTSAFQTDVIRREQGQAMLTVSCRGGDRLLVVLGDSGLSDGNFLLLTCPADETSTIQSIVPTAVSAKPFRLVVYERQPVTWKLLLSTYPVE